MRRRTRKLSPNRAIIYIVLLALLWCAKYIYENRLGTEHIQKGDTSLLVPSQAHAEELQHQQEHQQKSEESESSSSKSARDAAPKHKYSGWAELPAERKAKNLYYAYHLIAEEQADDPRRNYAVCFDSEQHCPAWIAAILHPSYNGDTKRIDNYQFDPQLPVNIQPNLKRSYGGDYSRGHLLGSAERNISRAANTQTFYSTNIAPQIRIGFNSAAGAWNNLEALVEKQICTDTLYVVTGCIFGEFTDSDGTSIQPTTITNRNDEKPIGVPTAYYKALLRTRRGDTGKSVLECKASELKCAAFVVGHRSAKGRKPSAKELISIKELERLTGEKFFVNVKHAPKNQAEPADWGL